MNVKIINAPLKLNVYGFSGVAVNKDYTGTAFKLSGKMWDVVKSEKINNKGLNIWVYEPGEMVFAGVELDHTPENNFGLEQKNITLQKYAYYKHVRPYNLIKQIGLNMQNEIKSKGFNIMLPYIEIYGHWTSDETKLETELFMFLK